MNPPSTASRLTDQAQAWWAQHLNPGDWALDATAGNGHDTVNLARLVGPTGRVWAVDCQPSALQTTAKAIQRAQLSQQVELLLGNHAELEQLLPAEVKGRLQAAVFNLGYLPGGDHALTTQADSTLAALQQAWEMLRAGGILSVLAYRGHPGGESEASAVAHWMQTHARPNAYARTASGTLQRPGPVWHRLQRK